MKPKLKEFLPLVVGLGLILFGGVFGWMAFSEWDSARLASEELVQKRQGSVLAQPGGVEIVKKDIALLEKSKTQLEREIQALVSPGEEAWGTGKPWSVDPGQWKDHLIELHDQIRKETGSPGQIGKVILLPDFYLGFEEYKQKSPSAAEIRGLGRQLSVVQRLLGHLLVSRQEVVEPFPTPCVLKSLKIPGAANGKPQDGSVGGAGMPPAKASAPSEGGPLRETYELTLECSPEIVINLLQRLTRDSWIFIPTNLRLENEQITFPKRAEFEKIFATPSGGTMPAAEGINPAAKAPLLLVLAGKEKLRVSLSVDFVSWPPTEAAASQPPAKRGS